MSTIAVTDQTFETEIMQSAIPVVVDFWAEWCGPCKQIAPALEQLSAEYGENVKVAKIDVDNNPNSASRLGVRGLPALFIVNDGEIVSNRSGAAQKSVLKEWIAGSGVLEQGSRAPEPDSCGF